MGKGTGPQQAARSAQARRGRYRSRNRVLNRRSSGLSRPAAYPASASTREGINSNESGEAFGGGCFAASVYGRGGEGVGGNRVRSGACHNRGSPSSGTRS